MPYLFRHLSGVNGFRALSWIEEGRVKGGFQIPPLKKGGREDFPLGSIGMKLKDEKGDAL
jgi:hypothetical protein